MYANLWISKVLLVGRPQVVRGERTRLDMRSEERALMGRQTTGDSTDHLRLGPDQDEPALERESMLPQVPHHDGNG